MLVDQVFADKFNPCRIPNGAPGFMVWEGHYMDHYMKDFKALPGYHLGSSLPKP